MRCYFTEAFIHVGFHSSILDQELVQSLLSQILCLTIVNHADWWVCRLNWTLLPKDRGCYTLNPQRPCSHISSARGSLSFLPGSDWGDRWRCVCVCVNPLHVIRAVYQLSASLQWSRSHYLRKCDVLFLLRLWLDPPAQCAVIIHHSVCMWCSGGPLSSAHRSMWIIIDRLLSPEGNWRTQVSL